MTPGPLEKDDEEAKDERALGHVVGMALKAPRTWMVMSALLAGTSIYRETVRPEPKPADSFSADEMRGLIRKEIAPLRAGIEALALAQSDRVQVKVLQAMLNAEKRNREVVQ